jgi:hypothetical protein
MNKIVRSTFATLWSIKWSSSTTDADSTAISNIA